MSGRGIDAAGAKAPAAAGRGLTVARAKASWAHERADARQLATLLAEASWLAARMLEGCEEDWPTWGDDAVTLQQIAGRICADMIEAWQR